MSKNIQKPESKGSFEVQNSRKQAENSRKTDKNRSKRTPNARRQHKTSSPKSASQVSGSGDKQRYPKQPEQADKKFQKVKNLDKNRTKQRPANAEKCAKCCSRPPEMETQAAPHVGSSPESPTRAIGAFRKVPRRQVMKKLLKKFFNWAGEFFPTAKRFDHDMSEMSTVNGTSRDPSPDPVQRNRKAKRSSGKAKAKPNFDPRPRTSASASRGLAVRMTDARLLQTMRTTRK